ncbi:MAG: hypothetical protein U0K66_03135 [Paludibacteraceae bacterium]|nr:hypothetical protein [Paludibacteraceae bacterium]
MRFVIVVILCLFAVVSCSRQNVESKEVVHDTVAVDVSTPITEDSVAMNETHGYNKAGYDTVIRRYDNEIVAYIKDTFLIKNGNNRVYNWKEIDEMARSLNDWNYSDNAVYITDGIEWEDDSGCDGDTMHISRNGIKIATFSNDRCGDMSSCMSEYYYYNGKVGYKRIVNEGFGGGCSHTYIEESKYSKDGESIYEYICKESENPVNDSILVDGWIETTTVYESVLKMEGKTVEVRNSNDSDTLYYTFTGPDTETMSKTYTDNDDDDLPDMAGEALSHCRSVLKY